jgi:hypothetical protein
MKRINMAESYESLFLELCNQVSRFSPPTTAKLQAIGEQWGMRVGYYAAFMIVYLHEHEQAAGKRLLGMSREELKSFTYFELVKDDPLGLDSFEELIHCYQNDGEAPAS